jgi:ribonuclease HII
VTQDISTPHWDFDQEWVPEGGLLLGIDEAGRGPLAGNVVAACVIFRLDEEPLVGLDDSKKLSAAVRDRLFEEIKSRALAYGIAEASPKEIDRINILQATFLAMRRAIEAVTQVLATQQILLDPSLILVDGNKVIPGQEGNQKAVVKGDGKSASIAAASILAKVTRDRQLKELAIEYPQYGFEQHKGYPTAAHREALHRHGLTLHHRRSFCDEWLSQTELFG